MATAEIKFYVLDVGQGACNYVEIIDDKGAVTHNMLIDLGTNSSQDIAAANLAWLRQRIVANNRYLDVLILTHGDTDHYNMVAKILPAFGAPNHSQIGMARYGGPNWRYAGGDLIVTLAGYTKLRDDEDLDTANMAGFWPNATSFAADQDPVWDPIWEVGGEGEPKLQLIIADTPHPKDGNLERRHKMNPEAVNTKSVVLGLEWENYWIVATGDATATTLEQINDLLEHVEPDELPTTFMMTLPHHGSRKTTYDLKLANNIPSAAAREVVDDFLEKFAPLTMSISAGEKRHHHPSIYMIEQFADHLSADVVYWSDPAAGNNRHFLTSWVDKTVANAPVAWPAPARWLYATTQTRDGIFSTLYFNTTVYNNAGVPRYIFPPDPPEPLAAGTLLGVPVPLGRNWQFSMDKDALNVDSTVNVARMIADAPDFAAVPAAPPPSVSAQRDDDAAIVRPAPTAIGLAAPATQTWLPSLRPVA